MSELSHQGAQRLIHQDQLTDAERFALRYHLRTCAGCRMHAIMAGVLNNHLVVKRSSSRPSPQFTAVYMETVARHSRTSQIMKPIYALGGAVALALIVLAGWYIVRANPQSATLESIPVEIITNIFQDTQVKPQFDATGGSVDEQLIAAIKVGNAAEVEKLLNMGANPDFFDSRGITSLPLAAREGQLEIVQFLLEAGADVNNTMNVPVPLWWSLSQAPALLHAAASGHLDVVELLLANGADPNKNKNGDGDVPLHHAAWFNHPEIVKTLLENGAEVDVRRTTSDGETPLHWAASNGSLESMEALIQAGADVNLKDLLLGKTALVFMVQRAPANSQIEMTNLLLDAGADVNLASNAGTTPLSAAIQRSDSIQFFNQADLLLKAGADPNLQDRFGDTALHHAAREGKEEALILLIENGALLDMQNNYGETALDVATSEQIEEMLRKAGATGGSQAETASWPLDEQLIAAVKAGDAAKVELLLNSGANPDFVDQRGKASLPLAADEGQLEIVQVLLEAGVDVNSTMIGITPDGDPLTEATALLYASASGHLDVVELLLANAADPNKVEKGNGYVPLHQAARYNHSDIVKTLLENGAEIDVRPTDAGGMTPLQNAISNGSLEAAEALIQAGADFNLQELRFGNTALLFTLGYAPEENQAELVNLLLDAGADVNLASNRGRTPLITAIQNNNMTGLAGQVSLLLEAGADPNLKDINGDTALHHASREDKMKVVVLLIDHGASVELQNNNGQTALDVATNYRIREMLRAVVVRD